MTPSVQRVRCAIYTRKSSDEGLEQAFNSLDAQREACAAYILSQASEGWSALPDIYDDGGLSGGTLTRPALQRLLAEVQAGRVDIIVVYKVDRLTRSLLDFSKLVEAFDKAGTSFVSVTQSFNTTTSMGRLTLNMLLSFAQFEREVTAERIRDKIAASKAKGMWMGGTPPIGYAPDGRTLRIVEPEAITIRRIFERYLALGSVRLVAEELQRDRVPLPVRQRLNGNGAIGGGWFSRGQIYKILANPIYIGRIAHGSITYAGLHPGIVDVALWEAAQAKLADNLCGHRNGTRVAAPSLLAGKVLDAAGEPLATTHSSNAGKRYRYYVSRDLELRGTSEGIRVPAGELDAAVTERVAHAFDDALSLAGSAGLAITTTSIALLGHRGAEKAAQLRGCRREVVGAIIPQVRLYRNRIEIDCDTAAIAAALQLEAAEDAPATLTLTADVTLTRTGRAMRLVQDNGAVATPIANPALVRLVIRARRWWATLSDGEMDIGRLAAIEGVQPAYIARVLRLAFLSPAVVDAILAGKVRAGVDTAMLTATGAVPASWQEQARIILPATTEH